MELKDKKNKQNRVRSFLRRWFSKKIILSFLLLLLFSVGYFGNKFVKTKDYTSLWDFVSTVSTNYWQGRGAHPESISIEIKEKDLKIIEKNRQQALDRGLIINDIDGEYVPATMEYKGKKMKIKLRLKGHMTDHIETENKWSFRIKVKDNDSFMGMKRFSIQQPGTRGYIYEWIYHELMKREGIIALKYTFVDVSINGKDWGIFAVEENFDKELIEHNNRKLGPILRLNPDLYWVSRFNAIKQEYITAEFASYYSSNFEAYQEDGVLADSVQTHYYLKALALADGFRNKKLTAAQVFDIDRLAKFHALIDLVGGEHSIDWSDIKYYYNPVSSKLEPIAYESFSSFSVSSISGNYRYVTIDSAEYFEDWHSAIFSDPVFFSAYVKNLERITKPSYLNDFFASSNVELDNNLKILYQEYPYKKFERASYYRNQVMIKKILDGPEGIHVFNSGVSDRVLHLQIGNIESLPMQINAVKIGNTEVKPTQAIILGSKQANLPIVYKTVTFILPANLIWTDSLNSNLMVNYCLLGSSKNKSCKVFPFPHTETEYLKDDLKNKRGNVAQFPFLVVDEQNKNIYIKPGKQQISSDLIVPAGYKLIANSGVSIDFIKKAKIISYSAFQFFGNEDQQMYLGSSDSSSEGIQLINAPLSTFQYVTFKNLPKIYDKEWHRTGALTFYESPVDFLYCNFYDSKAEDAINLIRSDFSIKGCLFHQMNYDAMNIDFSNGTLENCAFEACVGDALDITMGNVKVKSVVLNRVGNKAINIKQGAQITGSDLKIKNVKIALSVEDLSTAEFQNSSISDAKIGVAIFKNKKGEGSPSVKLKGLSFTNVKTNYLKEKDSYLYINGVEMKEEVENLKAQIKNDK